MGGQTYGWEINDLAGNGGSESFTLTGKLNPDSPRQDCTTSLRQNNARAIWGCGSGTDATDGDPTTQNYDCTHDTWANASVATLQMPDLIAIEINPEIVCVTDGSYSGAISVRVENQGDGDCTTAFTVQVTDGLGWTGSGTFSGTIADGAYEDITIDTQTWSTDCSFCGPYTFSAVVDLYDDVCECNESNNTAGPVTYTLDICNLEVLDIDFTNVVVNDDIFSGHIDVFIQNTGCDTARNFAVSLETEGSLTFSAQTIISLPPNEADTVEFNVSGPWYDCGGPGCEFTATVDPNGDLCECSGENKFIISPYAGPTNIVLSSFSASVTGNLVTLNWTTETEPNNAGFNIYRSTNESSNYVKINQALIPAQGSATTGGSYSFYDEPGRGTFYYKLQDIDLQGRNSFHGPVSAALTSVDVDKSTIPDRYSLSQNYPNPFNPETNIEYALPKTGFVTITIYDINGQLVRKLVSEQKPAGYHSIRWDGRNNSGTKVTSGLYFYFFKSQDFSQTKKMILMK